jgi:hypothetical protein
MKFAADRPIPIRKKPPASWLRSPTRSRQCRTVASISSCSTRRFCTQGQPPDEYLAALKLAIDRGWLWLHESVTYVKFTEASAELFVRRKFKPERFPVLCLNFAGVASAFVELRVCLDRAGPGRAVHIANEAIRILTRNGHDWTKRFAKIAAAKT